MTMSYYNYFQINGRCDYGKVDSMWKRKIYSAYTDARKICRINVEDLYNEHKTRSVCAQILFVFSEGDRVFRNVFSEEIGRLLYPLKNSGWDRLSEKYREGGGQIGDIERNWKGSVHDTFDFEINTCAWKSNNIIVAAQWYSVDVSISGKEFKVVFSDFAMVDLRGGKYLLEYGDGNFVCERKYIRINL